MAFCFDCGTLMHNDDARTHVCNEADKPVPGQRRKLATKEDLDAIRQ